MNTPKLIILTILLMGMYACAPYLYTLHIPATGIDLARHLSEESDPQRDPEAEIMLAERNEQRQTPISIEDTYRVAYGQSLSGLPANGDTGQRFTDMRTATRYFRRILEAEGVENPEHYLLTRVVDNRSDGFSLIAVIYRPKRMITVRDNTNPKIIRPLTPEKPDYYRPHRIDSYGRRVDTVLAWAAVPEYCFKEQARQAVFLTRTANKVFGGETDTDFWALRQEWQAGEIGSVVARQDYLACQSTGAFHG